MQTHLKFLFNHRPSNIFARREKTKIHFNYLPFIHAWMISSVYCVLLQRSKYSLINNHH